MPDKPLSESEVEQRREAAIKRMLNTPHKPHAEDKKRKPSRLKRATAKYKKPV
jgi:hypothetical protein